MRHGPEAWRIGAQWRAALVVAVLGPLAYVLVLYAMQLAPVSHVAPAREVSMLFAALVRCRLLGEADRAARLLGAGASPRASPPWRSDRDRGKPVDQNIESDMVVGGCGTTSFRGSQGGRPWISALAAR